MAKVLGSLVGALLVSTGFPGVNNFCKDGSDKIIVRDTAAVTTSNVIGDTISLGMMKSTALISPGATIWFDALGTGVKFNIGDVNHASGLASALDVSSAGSAALWKAFTPSKMAQPLWQALGYSSDPGGTIELLATIANANVGSGGSVAWQIPGINR